MVPEQYESITIWAENMAAVCKVRHGAGGAVAESSHLIHKQEGEKENKHRDGQSLFFFYLLKP